MARKVQRHREKLEIKPANLTIMLVARSASIDEAGRLSKWLRIARLSRLPVIG
ncbi:hypothetical protein RRSWK_07215 [Rhodopirellula sp. SWK7]|nr:hypothetical protein RRSWK_07215 [Rhodopirellula sp. SWK7]